jgi:hypothetical protein
MECTVKNIHHPRPVFLPEMGFFMKIVLVFYQLRMKARIDTQLSQ